MDKEKQLEEFKQLLTCPVCLDEFQDDTQTNLLPCLHSLCEECTPKMVKDGTITCPICRKDHPSKSFSADNTTRDLFDFVVVNKSENIACEGKGCDDGNMATHRCQPCGEFLCDGCVLAHRRTNVTREHNMIPLEELRGATDLNMFSHPQTCQIHEGKLLELYCAREECQLPICVTCAFVHHRNNEGHTLVDINEVAEKRRREISSKSFSVKEKSEAVTQVCRSIAEERDEITLREEKINTEVNAVIESLHQQVERARENLKKALVKQAKRKQHSLNKQEELLEKLKKNMEHSILYSDKVVCHSSTPAFLQLDKTIADRLDDLLQEPFDREPWERAAFGLDCKGVSGAVQNDLTQLLHIWSSSVYGPRTKILQTQAAVAGEESRFNVTLKNSWDKPVEENAHFEAIVTDPRGDTLSGRVKESGLHDGEFLVIYNPMVEGEYKLELKIQNRTFASHTFNVGDSAFGERPKDTEPKREEAEKVSVRFPTQMVSKNPEIFTTKSFRPIWFLLDKETAHKEVTVSADGTMFTNSQQAVIPKTSTLHPNRHRKFKGARGTHVFTHPGIYFYEVILEMRIICPMQQNNIAFEIGIARKSSIDKKKYIEGQPFAWSMIGAHHPPCDAICVHVVRDRKILLHKSLVGKEVDKQCRLVLGFLLNTEEGTWEIYNSEEGEKLCVVKGIDCDEPLFPVVSGYNASQIEVNATFVTGHDNIPDDMNDLV